MTFVEGHTKSVKLHTPELKALAYKQYCDHLALGLPKKAWRLRHPNVTLTWETMEKYIREDQTNFDPSQKKAAEADSLMLWFKRLVDVATGENTKGNVAAHQIIFRNMFKWDSKDQAHDDDDGTSQVAHEKLLSQLANLQKKAD